MNSMELIKKIQLFLGTAKRPLLVILGPTASGKTDLSLSLAKRFHGEIINADSRQMYRGMNIGTNKITKAEMKGIPHHLFDIRDPDQVYTVAEYKKDAVRLIRDILRRNKTPFLVGGTGLYINTVTMNYAIPKVKPDFLLREKLEKESKEKGADYLYKKLLRLDPAEAKKHHPHQLRYIIRALEIVLSGKKKSVLAVKKSPLFDVFCIGIHPPREILYERINMRAQEMVSNGLIEEVKILMHKGYDAKTHAMNGIGYKEIVDYLSGKISLEKAIALIQQNTRHFAKRQVTWFKRNPEIHWIRS